MNRVELKHIPLKPAARFAGMSQRLHRVLFVLFLVQFALVGAKLGSAVSWFGEARWPEGLLVVLAIATTLAGLTRQLPGQNVMLASIVIVFLAGGIQCLGALTGIPFGPYEYNVDHVGQYLFPPLPWSVPLIWLVFLLNSRGVARLILRPWRPSQAYGFWLLMLTILLVVLLDIGLEPFATMVKGYWSWKPTRLPSSWYTTPWVNFLGWTVSALLILAFVTPVLIRKKPGKFPPDYHPLVVWLLLNVLFLTGAAVKQLWTAVGVILAQSILIGILAIVGTRKSGTPS